MARFSKKKRINVTVGYQNRFASGFSRTKNTLDSRHINGERFSGESKTRLWLQGFIEYVTNFDLVKTYNLILLFWFIASVVATPAFRLLLYTLILNHALMTIVEVNFWKCCTVCRWDSRDCRHGYCNDTQANRKFNSSIYGLKSWLVTC